VVNRRLVSLGLVAATALAIPGSSENVQAQQTNLIRVAMLSPRDSERPTHRSERFYGRLDLSERLEARLRAAFERVSGW
jgi:hypothetical protein